MADIKGRRDGGETSLCSETVCVCWRVLVMHSLVSTVMRWGQGRWDVGDENGLNPCCETPSDAGEGRRKKELRSTHWESPWRRWEWQVYYGLFQQRGLTVWPGLMLQGWFAKTLASLWRLYTSQHDCLCNYRNVTSAEEVSCGAHTPPVCIFACNHWKDLPLVCVSWCICI